MPSRPQALRTTVLTAATVVALSACSGNTTGTARRGTDPTPDAAALAALADTRPTTALPPATGTTDQPEADLRRTLPVATAAAGQDAPSVAAALAFTAHVVAVTRLDRAFLCGPQTASPAGPLATPYLRGYLDTSAQNRSGLEATIGGGSGRDDCGALRWVGPGVVLGPQTWTVGPGIKGTDLTVTWEGTAGYVLADTRGIPEPWGLDHRMQYGLTRQGAGWQLGTWDSSTAPAISGTWPAKAPIPNGYLDVPKPPAADPAALGAVHAAADLWRKTQAVTVTTTASTDASTNTAQGQAVTGFTATGTAAPARGDNSSTVTYAQNGAQIRTLHLDHGNRVLVQVTGTPKARPGKTLQSGLAWTSQDDTTPATFNAGYGDNPFGAVALLADTGTAVTAPCPTGLTAVRCYTAVVVTDDTDPLASNQVGASRRSGRPYLHVDVGLDRQGRPAFIRGDQTVYALGTRYAGLTGTTTFTGYADTPPPAVTVPDPATVAPATDLDL